MKILVINAGSSSLKYQLFDMESGAVLAKGNSECIGTGGIVTHKKTGAEPFREEIPLADHAQALAEVLRLLTDPVLGVIADISEIDAVGHRIVHGGKCVRSMLVDDELVNYLETIVPINPLHGPPAIAGIKGCRQLMPDKPQVTVFDTSFFGTMPPHAYTYAIPYELYEEKKIRRYGFHGTSHRYVSQRVAKLIGKPIEDLKIITCHLGNGSSISAVKGGKVIDTSMGFTPLDGIIMGTRCGSIDAAIVPYVMQKENIPVEKIGDWMNKECGLAGVTGASSDLRDIHAAIKAGNEDAKLAFEILLYGIKKFIGSYTAAMNGVDAIVFTAGIGENDEEVRFGALQNLDYLGIKLDAEKNLNARSLPAPCDISAADSKVRIFVIPTDEELVIPRDTKAVLSEM